jgi:cell division transport system permease protein
MAVTRNVDAVAPVRKSGPVTTWLTRHFGTAVGALGRLVRQPFASLMIVLVIAVTLAIPASLNLVVKNAQALSSGWDNALDFSMYLKKDVSESEAEGLARLVEQRADVESVRLITASAALAEFK